MRAWLLLLAGCAPVVDDPSAEACGSCHAAEYDAWSRSPHARSADTDVFLALLPEVEIAWGPEAADRCRACHAPAFGGDEGVGCVACHAATGNRQPSDGALVVDLRAPLAGPRGALAPHATTVRPLLGDPALCATCHDVTGPGLLEEHTGREHARVRASGLDDRTCADCHLGDHGFTGLEPDQEPEAVRDLLARALSLSVDGAVVRVENGGAGHDVPTGAAFLRELRVDVRRDGAWVPVMALAPRPVLDGGPVALPTEADGFAGRGLARGEAREVVVAGGFTEARVVFRAWREDLTGSLGVEAAPEVVVLQRARE